MNQEMYRKQIARQQLSISFTKKLATVSGMIDRARKNFPLV